MYQLNAVTLAGPHQNLDLHATIRHNATGGRTRQQHRNIVGEFCVQTAIVTSIHLNPCDCSG